MISAFELIESYRVILVAQEELAHHIRDELAHYPLWIAKDCALIEDREFAVNQLGEHSGFYESAQQTLACPGAIACTEQTVKLLATVNDAKRHFKEQVQQFKQKRDDTDRVRQLLANAGFKAIREAVRIRV